MRKNVKTANPEKNLNDLAPIFQLLETFFEASVDRKLCPEVEGQLKVVGPRAPNFSL